MIAIGIIREGKVPPDARTPLTPSQCAQINKHPEISVAVEASDGRCFKDDEYREAGVEVVQDVSGCDVLMGVKEVPVEQLIPNKTYFFFSHTIKKQPYNRDLLREIIRQGIRLVDYEVLTDDLNRRLIAFGRFAGMVGAHNAIWAYGKRTGSIELPRMVDCHDYNSIKSIYQRTVFPTCKVVLTGTGRVANGAAEVLNDMGFTRVDHRSFITQHASVPTYTQLGVTEYARKTDGSAFEEQEYFDHPERFIIDFRSFANAADIMINGIYWDPKAPAFFSLDEMAAANFNIGVIADVTCDIAPESSIPSTLRAATIASPVFDFDPETHSEAEPFQKSMVTMMTVDNLPNELPRDASESFGQQFISNILSELSKEQSDILDRATIAVDGGLGPNFAYLEDYVA